MKQETLQLKDIIEGERSRIDYGDIDSLADSIKQRGLITPIAVMEMPEGKYKLLAGGRRLRAVRKNNVETIPAHIYPEGVENLEQKAIELAENIQRQELSWDESVKIKRDIHEMMVSLHGEKVARSADAPGHSMADTAKLLGESTANISRDIHLAKMVELAPELGSAKNKSTANKMLQKAGGSITTANTATAIEKKAADDGLTKVKKNIMDAYFVKDFFEGVKTVKDNSIDVIELDPPYGIDLHTNRKTEGDGKLGMIGYNEVEPEKYPDFLMLVMQECYRVLKPGGWIILWFAPDPWFEYVSTTMLEFGFKGKTIPLIWTKPQGQTKRPDLYLANCYEMAFYARKGPGDDEGRTAKLNVQGKTNVFAYKSVPSGKKIHPTERPIEMIQDVLLTFAGPGSVVMVPFAGSGNTLLAAANLGMIGFGFDLTKEYRDAFVLRVAEGTPGRYSSYED